MSKRPATTAERRGTTRRASLREGDSARLDDLEERIGSGLRMFLEVGQALLEINERRLYRLAGYGTFAEYCEARWQLTRGNAYRKLDVARVVNVLTEAKIETLPANEAQVRELAKLKNKPDLLADAWQEVIDADADGAGPATARDVREAVQGRLTPTRSRQDTPPRQARAPLTSHTCPHCGHTWETI